MWVPWSVTDDNEIAEKVLSYVLDDFSGELLDVPVGTAVFTEKKWRSLRDARITCLDYSEDMIKKAKVRLGDCKHISFIACFYIKGKSKRTDWLVKNVLARKG